MCNRRLAMLSHGQTNRKECVFMKHLILVLAAALAAPLEAQEEFMLAYASWREVPGPEGRVLELYLMRGDGSRKTRLTFNEGPEIEPAWSADGRHIYYWSNHHRLSTPTFAGDVFRMALPWSPVPLPDSFLPSAVEAQSWGAIKKARRR